MRWLHTAFPTLLLFACGAPARVLPTRVPELAPAAIVETRALDITPEPTALKATVVPTVAPITINQSPTAAPVEANPQPTATSPAPSATFVPATPVVPTALPTLRPTAIATKIPPPPTSVGQAAPTAQPPVQSLQPLAPSPQTQSCASLTFDELRKRGPRPSTLASLTNGDCVTVKFASGESRYVWRPAGTQMTLANSMYVRWPDGLVSVYFKDGRHVANEFYRGKQNELELLRRDGKLMLPASKSFVFAENGPTVTALVDVLVKVK